MGSQNREVLCVERNDSGAQVAAKFAFDQELHAENDFGFARVEYEEVNWQTVLSALGRFQRQSDLFGGFDATTVSESHAHRLGIYQIRTAKSGQTRAAVVVARSSVEKSRFLCVVDLDRKFERRHCRNSLLQTARLLIVFAQVLRTTLGSVVGVRFVKVTPTVGLLQLDTLD